MNLGDSVLKIVASFDNTGLVLVIGVFFEKD